MLGEVGPQLLFISSILIIWRQIVYANCIIGHFYCFVLELFDVRRLTLFKPKYKHEEKKDYCKVNYYDLLGKLLLCNGLFQYRTIDFVWLTISYYHDSGCGCEGSKRSLTIIREVPKLRFHIQRTRGLIFTVDTIICLKLCFWSDHIVLITSWFKSCIIFVKFNLIDRVFTVRFGGDQARNSYFTNRTSGAVKANIWILIDRVYVYFSTSKRIATNVSKRQLGKEWFGSLIIIHIQRDIDEYY